MNPIELLKKCVEKASYFSLSFNTKMPYSKEMPENPWRIVAPGVVGYGKTVEEAIEMFLKNSPLP